MSRYKGPGSKARRLAVTKKANEANNARWRQTQIVAVDPDAESQELPPTSVSRVASTSARLSAWASILRNAGIDPGVSRISVVHEQSADDLEDARARAKEYKEQYEELKRKLFEKSRQAEISNEKYLEIERLYKALEVD